MATISEPGRTDRASRVIAAPAQLIYRALLDPQAVVAWRPPEGMTAEVYTFDAREGGRFRMAFIYRAADRAAPGKTTDNADVFEGRFVKLVPDELVVEEIVFESDDPEFAGVMTVTTRLATDPAGTRVDIVCENVPSGIRPEDHQTGMASTLANLAAHVEGPTADD